MTAITRSAPTSWAPTSKILLLSSDTLHCKLTSFLLHDAGHHVTVAVNEPEAVVLLQRDPPDLILLDTNLREIDSLSLCRQLRSQFNRPIIFLTKCSDVQDRVRGLHAGADDYVAQPFEPQELLARIAAVMRRYQSRVMNERMTLVVGDLSLEPVRRAVSTPEQQETILTEREYQMLLFLMQQPGRVVSTNDLLSAVWGKEANVNHNLVYIYISRLRRKIGDNPQQPRFLIKVEGQGYCLMP